MPIACNRTSLKCRRPRLQLNQNNNRRGQCHRRSRMQQDAKWAVVGIRVYRMHVRRLNHSQQRQQNQAHHGDNRQSEWLYLASSPEI